MTDAPRPARPVFPTPGRSQVAAPTPEILFGELPRRRDGVGALWSHQVDQLRDYHRDHLETPDVALELPTGSGKTLVGLLVGEWRRRSLGQRVVYACPTRQLALQVVEAAARQGIDAHPLIDSHRGWNPRQVTAYTRAHAMAVTTYSHIFNSHSHLADPKTVVFDDAHAAEVREVARGRSDTRRWRSRDPRPRRPHRGADRGSRRGNGLGKVEGA